MLQSIDLESYILSPILYLGVCILLLVLARTIYKVLHPTISLDDELVEKDNVAFSLAQVGYYAGVVIAMGGIMTSDSHDNIWMDLLFTFIFGIVSIVFMNLSSWLNDKFLLYKFNIKKELIEDQNAGTGAIEAGSYIATGLILYGTLQLEAEHPISALGYWLIAEIFLLLTAHFYTWMVPFDLHKQIEEDNVAVGISFGGMITALGILIEHGIALEHDTWLDGLMFMTFHVISGIILLPILRLITDKILLPKRKLVDEIVNQEKPNIGAALIEAFAYIGGAVLFTWCFQ